MFQIDLHMDSYMKIDMEGSSDENRQGNLYGDPFERSF